VLLEAVGYKVREFHNGRLEQNGKQKRDPLTRRWWEGVQKKNI